MSHEAPALMRQAASPTTARAATALDLALCDYHRRYGDVRLEVTSMKVTRDGGVEWTVRARPRL